jgi:hypothetical protein
MTCASLGENGLPSMDPVAPGAGWKAAAAAGGALALADDAGGAAALVGLLEPPLPEPEADDDAGASGLDDEPDDDPADSSDEVSASLAEGFCAPPQAARTRTEQTRRWRMNSRPPEGAASLRRGSARRQKNM